MKTFPLSFVLSFLLCIKCIYANDTLVIKDNLFQIDSINKLALVNQNIEQMDLSFPITTIKLNGYYIFKNSIDSLNFGIAYKVENSKKQTFTLYFTQLPIICLFTNLTIEKENKVVGNFFMSESNENLTSSVVGIRHRGFFTNMLPKKSYRVEFWSDSTGENKSDVSLLNMRNDDDWNLLAMFNEPMKINNKTCFELWEQIDTLYYQDIESKAVNGSHLEFIELFLNKKYQGIYALEEPVDRKQLKLKKTKDSNINGELYKGVDRGASIFIALPSYNNNSETWSGFEFKYPDEFIDWANIYDFVDFVMNIDDDTFYKNIEKRFYLKNAVNYFIFINLLRATDNEGKNIFIAKYNQDGPYFYVPWDLDGTFGTIWNGMRENVTNDIVTNGFYNRLLRDKRKNGFCELLTKRWNELRQFIFQKDYLVGLLKNNFYYLDSNGIFEREAIAWKYFYYFDKTYWDYANSWIESRLAYLDEVFNNPSLLTSVSQPSENENEEFYINYSQESSAIKIDLKESTYPFSLKIYNSAGILVFSKDNINSSMIQISNLQAGVYFAIIYSYNKIKTGKFIVIE